MDTKPDVVVAFALTTPAKMLPNIIIAENAINVAHKYCVPIVTQKEISDNFNTNIIAEKGIKVITIPQNKYLATLDIAEATKNLSEVKKWKTVFLVSGKPHQKRCIRDLEKMGFIVIKERDPIEYYDPNALWRTRHKWVNWLREKILLTLPWPVYKRIARGK